MPAGPWGARAYALWRRAAAARRLQLSCVPTIDDDRATCGAREHLQCVVPWQVLSYTRARVKQKRFRYVLADMHAVTQAVLVYSSVFIVLAF